MGSVLQSQCKCGFESYCLSVEGRMMDFNEKCWTPCYCDECELVMTINILTKEGKKGWYRCPKCYKRVKYYGEIREDNFEYQVFDWRINFEKSYSLKNKLYYCPKCKEENLQFYLKEDWD